MILNISDAMCTFKYNRMRLYMLAMVANQLDSYINPGKAKLPKANDSPKHKAR